jgi:hypothetical protein
MIGDTGYMTFYTPILTSPQVEYDDDNEDNNDDNDVNNNIVNMGDNN